MQQQKQQQLQQQHLCLNEKLILIQFNLISIDFVFFELFSINFARQCSTEFGADFGIEFNTELDIEFSTQCLAELGVLFCFGG